MSFSRIANPFAEPAVASRYEAWYQGPGHRWDILEKRLLGKLLAEFPAARTALEVGCGTGHFTRWLAASGLATVGLDLSGPMLAEARRLGGLRCIRGEAQALPFRDRAFDLVVVITALEFVENPLRALEEAVRVARYGLLLGVLNRWSLPALRRRVSGRSLWRAARFLSVGELKRLVRHAGGSRLRSLRWRTTLWPVPSLPDAPLPWGGFIGMAVELDAPASGLETNRGISGSGPR